MALKPAPFEIRGGSRWRVLSVLRISYSQNYRASMCGYALMRLQAAELVRLAGDDEKVCTHQNTEANDDSPNLAGIGFLRVVRTKPSSAQGPDDHHHALVP